MDGQDDLSLLQENLILLGSHGLQIKSSLAFGDQVATTELAPKSKQVRCFDVSCDGKNMVWVDGVNVLHFYDLVGQKELWSETCPTPNVINCKLSPLSTLVATCSPYASNVSTSAVPENLVIWNVPSEGQIVARLQQKKQSRWEPFWSAKEEICVRHVNTELLVHEKNFFERWAKKMSLQKVSDYSVSTNLANNKHLVACYTAGSKGQPNFVRIYQYPQLDGNPIANKCFFKSDSVTFKWNPTGNAVIVICATDVDKSGKSYYGEQTLQYLDTGGSTSHVTLDKDGPVHCVEWLPTADPAKAKLKDGLFCAVYGFMPAKAALFNSSSDKVFQFGDQSARNFVSFNPFGSLMALCGFGNLRGDVEIWDVKNRKLLIQSHLRETTNFHWCPDGTHFMTATTSPRLRVGNGWRIWSYDGRLNSQEAYDINNELWRVMWRPVSQGARKEVKLSAINANSNAPPKKIITQDTSKSKYVPPALRKANEGKLMEPGTGDAEKTSNKPKATEQEKQIHKLKEKMRQIKKIKTSLAEGKPIDKHQTALLEKENMITEQLQKLRVG